MLSVEVRMQGLMDVLVVFPCCSTMFLSSTNVVYCTTNVLCISIIIHTYTCVYTSILHNDTVVHICCTQVHCSTRVVL